MIYRGKVQNGVVVLQEGAELPEGVEVSVLPDASPQSTDDSQQGATIWQKLAALGRRAETQPCDLPEDLAANHDHYLHGLPKRK